MKKNSAAPIASVLKTGAVLLIISAVIALVLAVVNGATAPVIAANEKKEKERAIASIFPQANVCTLTEYTTQNVEEFYQICADDTLLGYCCTVICPGFSDNITMMIGVNADGTLRKIEILSIADTPGIGLQVQNEAYLSKYAGLADTNEETLLIAGATYSSVGVRQGAQNALSACAAYTAMTEEGGHAE